MDDYQYSFFQEWWMMKKTMISSYDEKQNEGLERWLWQIQKYNINHDSENIISF